MTPGIMRIFHQEQNGVVTSQGVPEIPIGRGDEELLVSFGGMSAYNKIKRQHARNIPQLSEG